MPKWRDCLTRASEVKYNVAHVSSVDELTEAQVVNYVDRCLGIASKETRFFDDKSRKIVTRVIQWMDVAKCGSAADKETWKQQCPGICLDIHNEASADIYLVNSDDGDDDWTKEIVYELIRTHGLIGQHAMGECNLDKCAKLNELNIDKPALFKILKALNHAIIGGISENLWKDVQPRITFLTYNVVNGVFKQEEVLDRLKKLFPAFKNVNELTEEEKSLYEYVFAKASLWYPTVALQNFARNEIKTIFKTIVDFGIEDVDHINFYDFSKELAYDRDGKLKENVYKKRILEVMLREMSEGIDDTCEKEHVHIECVKENGCMKFHVKFTPVCAALVNFCVEAEKSGFANYQKNIITIFDMFGFRRDIFDRLANEEQYLETMNNAQTSTKMSILDYVKGELVLDVGSGGGVLLDALEVRFPEKRIFGTDISQNVIEVLTNKINKENHKYDVFVHNFVHQRLWSPVDSIIFSSILHEVFSYTEIGNKKFETAAVIASLYNAFDSLKHGGRIIIRDGVKTNSKRIVSVKFKDEDSLTLAKSYLSEFQGLKELKDKDGSWFNLKIEGDVITGNINLIREMLYTITWGPMSYPQEVQEQFGYFTLEEFNGVMNSVGFEIIESREFPEPGYPEHLDSKVDLIDFTWDDIPSNCIIVAEKR